MKSTRLAVIDLGSNTFHLLIIEISPEGKWQVLCKDRHYVKLASDGIGYIGEESMSRALKVMHHFSGEITAWQVDQTRALGTAALREASNGMEVAEKIAAETGIRVEIIDGHEEAYLIYKGIAACLPAMKMPCLIMDIGGGSVEFILYKEDHILFKTSLRIGVAVLYRLFHRTDPISLPEIRELNSFLEKQLSPLEDTLRATGSYYLIGASGSFEVIQDILPKISGHPHWSELDTRTLEEYLDGVIALDVEARRGRPEIPPERLDYIVVAYLLIRYLITQAPPKRLFYCDFALKEGALAEMIRERSRIV